MEIYLPSDVEDIINRQIESGDYSSPDEVIVQALWLLDSWHNTDEEKLEKLRQAVQEGVESGFSSRSVEELFDELLEKSGAVGRNSAGSAS